jgi:CCGSCS motif protein
MIQQTDLNFIKTLLNPKENIMFNIFKKNNEQAKNDATLQSTNLENMSSENSNVESENKKVHGQEGVCCRSCGGE